MRRLDTLRSDVAFAVRLLRRNRTFAAAVVATLAIGIAAATTMLSVVHGVLLRPLPIADQTRVVVLRKEQIVGNETLVPFSVRDLRDYAAHTRTLTAVAGAQYDGAWPSVMRDGDRVLSPNTAVVSGNLFQALGMRPAVGRLFREDDDVAGGNAMVMSYAFWQRAFGGDSSVIGRRMLGAASGQSFRIVGVMPSGFAFPGHADVLVPVLTVMPDALTGEGQWPFNLVARLRPEATAEQAREELARFLARKTYVPGEPRDVRASVRPIESLIVGDVRRTVLVLAGAVALLLVLANVNVTNLFLVHGVARRRELAVRAALGADAWRIGQLLIVEGVVLATLGGALGVIAATSLVHLLVGLAPVELPRVDAIRLDGVVMSAAAAMVTLSALAFSGWPALAGSRRRDLHVALKSGSRAGTPDRAAPHGRRLLVVTQVALAIVMLIGAGLLVRTMATLHRLELGYARDELETIELSLPAALGSNRQQLATFYTEVTERLARMPGATAATLALLPPFSGNNGWDAFYSAEGQTASDAAANTAVDLQPVLPTFFSTMGVALGRGRSISSGDVENSPRVAVVSRSFAERTWPGQDPIGKRFKFGHADAPVAWTTVVGVAEDVRYRELVRPRPVVYVPWVQAVNLPPLSFVVVRGQRSHAFWARDIERVVRETDPRVLVTSVASMRERLASSLARPRFETVVLATFALVALALAAVGVYAVIAALVRQRTQEIGIRVALGAQAGHVRAMVLRDGLLLASGGVVVGLAASTVLTRLLGSELYGVGPSDPVTLALATVVLLAISAFACWLPARAAMRVDPLTALRSE